MRGYSRAERCRAASGAAGVLPRSAAAIASVDAERSEPDGAPHGEGGEAEAAAQAGTMSPSPKMLVPRLCFAGRREQSPAGCGAHPAGAPGRCPRGQDGEAGSAPLPAGSSALLESRGSWSVSVSLILNRLLRAASEPWCLHLFLSLFSTAPSGTALALARRAELCRGTLRALPPGRALFTRPRRFYKAPVANRI